MIRAIEMLGYRGVDDARVELERFTLLTGSLASAPALPLDALAFLGDLVRDGPERAIEGDAARCIPRRGLAARDLLTDPGASALRLAIEVAIPTAIAERIESRPDSARYEIEIGTPGEAFELRSESLVLLRDLPAPRRAVAQGILFALDPTHPPSTLRDDAPVVAGRKVFARNAETRKVWLAAETSESTSVPRFAPDRTALAQLPDDEERYPAACYLRHLLRDRLRRVALDANALREPSAPWQGEKATFDGSDLPRWLERAAHPSLQASPEIHGSGRHARWLADLRRALPWLEFVAVEELPADRLRSVVFHGRDGDRRPAYGVQEGVLRLAALTALGWFAASDEILLIDEPGAMLDDAGLAAVIRALDRADAAQTVVASVDPRVAARRRSEA
jgi:hypothetical protein